MGSAGVWVELADEQRVAEWAVCVHPGTAKEPESNLSEWLE